MPDQVKYIIAGVEWTGLQYMCWHNRRFSQLRNCGMWVNMSRHLTCGFMAQNYVTAASRGSFTPEMVLLISTDGLEPASWRTWLPAAFRMENCYSSCSGVWNTRLREVKHEKRLLHLQGEVKGAQCFAVWDTFTIVWLVQAFVSEHLSVPKLPIGLLTIWVKTVRLAISHWIFLFWTAVSFAGSRGGCWQGTPPGPLGGSVPCSGIPRQCSGTSAATSRAPN